MNSMRVGGSLLVFVLLMLLLPPGQATAQSAPTCESLSGCAEAATSKQTDGFRVTAGRSDVVPGRGTPATHGEAPGRSTWLELDEYMTPACPTNGLHGADALCTAALVTCPEGQIRWWVWHQETRGTRTADGGVDRQVGPWQQLPGSFCLGGDDPGVPDYGRAISMVQAGFKDLPLPRAEVRADPAPTSLVNVPTAFFAGGEQSFTQTVTPIPGISVTVTAKPIEWQWTWGDGQTGSFKTPGVPKRPVVAHPYAQAKDYQASVAVSWKGSFTIAGSGQVFDIPSPAVVPSEPVTVQVREARTQLVDQ